MRTAVLCVLLLFGAMQSSGCQLAISRNDIDLSQWEIYPTGQIASDQGIWEVFGTDNNSVRQTANPNKGTHFVSDFTITSAQVIRGTLTGLGAGGGADDDFLGFSLGLDCVSNPPNPIVCTGEAVNLVWGNGSDSPGGTSSGLCARRESVDLFTGCPATTNPTFCDEVTDDINVSHGLDGHLVGANGVVFANDANFHPAFTCIETNSCPASTNSPCCDTICAAPKKMAWIYDRSYDFIIFYTPSRLRVFVDEIELFDYSPEDFNEPLMNTNGRASFSARSQPQDFFANFQLLDTGTTGCASDPWEASVPFEQTTCSGTLSLFVDYGDSTTETISPTGNTFELSHVYAPTPNGFYTVQMELRENGAPVSPASEETLLAFVLDEVTPVITADTNGACGFPMTCAANSGSVSLTSLSGGNRPYTLDWSGNGVSQTDTEPVECGSGSCSAQITGLNAGTYFINARDSNTCSGSDSVTIGTSSVQITSLSSTACGDITASLNFNCGPLSFSWTDSNGNPTASPNTQNQSGLAPGTYTLVATDPNGCSDVESITIDYGLTGSFEDNDRIFMYVGGLVTWGSYPPGSTGEVHFRCDSVGTDVTIFSGDLSTTQGVNYQPSKILPATDCVIEIQGNNNSGCYDSISPLFLCTHPNVGAAECFF